MKSFYESRCPVAGVSITFLCQNEQLLTKLSRLYPKKNPVFHESKIVIKLCASCLPPGPPQQPASFRLSKNILYGRSGSSYFVSDRSTMTASAGICQNMLENEYLLRHQILNSMLYFLLTFSYYTPLHCACLYLERTACIFIGKSGAGKSTLALAALTRGWPILSEDICLLGKHREDVYIHGDCREIHAASSSGLTQLRLKTTHNGKKKFIIPVPKHQRVEFEKNLAVFFIKPVHSHKESSIAVETDNRRFKELLFPNETGFSLYSKNRKNHIEALSQKTSYTAYIGNDLDLFFKRLSHML